MIEGLTLPTTRTMVWSSVSFRLLRNFPLLATGLLGRLTRERLCRCTRAGGRRHGGLPTVGGLTLRAARGRNGGSSHKLRLVLEKRGVLLRDHVQHTLQLRVTKTRVRRDIRQGAVPTGILADRKGGGARGGDVRASSRSCDEVGVDQ